MRSAIGSFNKNYWEITVFAVIIIAAAILRFYRLPEYMTFLGDEGRDVLVVRDILVNHHFPLLGPTTSVGNIYLGPLYYYMMAVPMAIFWLNPVAAAGMVASIGVATVCLVYYLARKWFGALSAVFAATLYAISPVTIVYSRSSWNPDPAPFFALLSFLGLYKARVSHNFLWFVLSGAALSAALQMHYLAMILLPIFGLLWMFELVMQVNNGRYRYFFIGTLGALAVFLILLLPWIIFDIRHDFMNLRALIALFSTGGSSVGLNIFDGLGRLLPTYTNKLIGRYVAGGNSVIALLAGAAAIVPLLIAIRRRLVNKIIEWPYLALGVWLVGGLVGLSLYKQEIYDHYLGFISPVPFLLLSGSVGFLKSRWRVLVVLALILLGVLNLGKNPLLSPPNNQLFRTQEVAKFVIAQSQGKPFNFALIAKNNYDAAYQYYLDLDGHKPKAVPFEITDQLFVVCEDEVCNPIGHPKYEIAAFGWAKVETVSEVFGVKVYKLVSNPSGKPS